MDEYYIISEGTRTGRFTGADAQNKANEAIKHLFDRGKSGYVISKTQYEQNQEDKE
ncbi:hypothetical protein GOV10_06390 [Candidatus Woesearchaeota archaeon]|nr:hypothetical protein [Candidatus Woesearchaeota archaeon]